MANFKSKQKTIPGIIGGMGPLAHTILEQILIEQSAKRGAELDQDHPIWLLISATNVPNRTDSLLGKTESCVPWLVNYGKFLQAAGADFIVIPCNTAHAFYEQVQSQLQIPWIHLIDHTTQFIVENHSNIKKIGILSTDGTLRTALYQNSLFKACLMPISFPSDSEAQKLVMNTIYDVNWGIKATGSKISPLAQENLKTTVEQLAKQGAEIVIAGCAELSVGFYETDKLALPWLDPLEIIAKVTLDLAFGHRTLPKEHLSHNDHELIPIRSLLS
jgi:aspartate racemase